MKLKLRGTLKLVSAAIIISLLMGLMGVQLSSAAPQVQRGETYTISGVLVDENGDPVQGITVTVTDTTDGQTIGSDVTGSSGSWSVTWNVPSNTQLGTHRLKIESESANYYEGTTSYLDVEVVASGQATLSVEDIGKVHRGDTVIFTGTLRDDQGNPVQGATITIEGIGTCQTNQNGGFSKTYTIPNTHPLGPKTVNVQSEQLPGGLGQPSATVNLEVWSKPHFKDIKVSP